jgi:hypothetical protein
MIWSNAMALNDPQSVTIGAGSAISLPRISESPNGEYLSADGTVSMLVKQVRGSRLSSSVSLRVAKLSANPYDASKSNLVYNTVTINSNRPTQGFTAAELLDNYKALIAQLAASSDAVIKKVLGLEK